MSSLPDKCPPLHYLNIQFVKNVMFYFISFKKRKYVSFPSVENLSKFDVSSRRRLFLNHLGRNQDCFSPYIDTVQSDNKDCALWSQRVPFVTTMHSIVTTVYSLCCHFVQYIGGERILISPQAV